MAPLRIFLLWFEILAVISIEAFSIVTNTWRANAKEKLLTTISEGASEEEVLKAIRGVEFLSSLSVGGGGASLTNPLLEGNWLMVWTTSDSIAGKNRPKMFRTQTPPEQYLNISGGQAVNSEYLLGGILRNTVKADITPSTKNKVDVSFREFSVGPIAVIADSEKFKGELSVTYLDEDMRISRGDLGNAFVLLRESTQRQTANRLWKEWQQSW